MPDYYSVMLEIAKDRATAASMVTCSTEDFDAGLCPDAVAAGDRYLQRAANKPCKKLVSLNNICTTKMRDGVQNIIRRFSICVRVMNKFIRRQAEICYKNIDRRVNTDKHTKQTQRHYTCNCPPETYN